MYAEGHRKEKQREATRRWRVRNPDKARCSSRASYARNAPKRRADRRSWYRRNRAKQAASVQRYRAAHRTQVNQWAKAERQRTRLLVLEHYGGSPPCCACCGEASLNFLSIDHIGGGGAAHRRSLPGSRRGFTFLRWLKLQGFPPGFRVLCFNCNLAEGFYGACPHKEVSK